MRTIHTIIAATLVILVAGCSSSSTLSRQRKNSGSVRAPSPSEAHDVIARAASSPSLPEQRRILLEEAEQWIGVPYSYGGHTREGTDCSGFVQSVYATAECKLPRSSPQQASRGAEITIEESLPGDLVFFNTSGAGVSHVGILLDRDRFVHASTKLGVTVNSLSEEYYRRRLMFVRRILQ